MNFFSRTQIGPRLATAFGIIIAFLLAIAAVGWLSIRSIDESLELLATDSYTKVKLANEILAGVNKQARATRNALIYGTAAEREAQLAAADNARVPVAEAYAKLEARVRSTEGRAQLATVLRLREAYLRELPKFESLVRAGDLDVARMQLLDHRRGQTTTSGATAVFGAGSAAARCAAGTENDAAIRTRHVRRRDCPPVSVDTCGVETRRTREDCADAEDGASRAAAARFSRVATAATHPAAYDAAGTRQTNWTNLATLGGEITQARSGSHGNGSIAQSVQMQPA